LFDPHSSSVVRSSLRDFAQRFDDLFRLEEIFGSLKLSPVYLKKINQWLQNDERLLKQIKRQVNRTLDFFALGRVNIEHSFQHIIKIYNRQTHEEMLYNYMRSQRPQTKSEQSAES
jgi:hypothetical protein